MAFKLKMYNSDKEIKTVTLNQVLTSARYPDDYPLKLDDSYYYRSGAYYPVSTKSIAKKFVSQHATTVPKEGALYFDKSSKFPRVKLSGTKFKRVLKIASCDYFVMNSDNIDIYTTTSNDWNKSKLNLYESDTDFYDIPTMENSYLDDNDKASIRKFLKISKSEDIIDGLIKIGLVPSNVTCLGEKIYYMVNDKNERAFLDNYLSNLYAGKSYITDKDLDELINKTLDDITEDDFLTFNDMFSSEDKEVVGMGLKLLSNYNVSKYPYAITTLFNLNYLKICTSSIWNSVGLKQLQSSINYKTPAYGDFPANILGLKTKSEGFAKDDVDIAFKLADIHWNKFETEIEDTFNKMLAEKGLI